jgi:predicted aspartyl protease
MLKKLLLAAVATLAVSSAAHATYLCDKPTQLVGKSGTNPVVSTRVGVDTETKHWFVFHTLRDGTVIDRRLQYNMQFIPERPGADFGWSGFSTRNKDLWMFGAVRPSSQDGSTITYVEELHDQAHGNRLVMQSSAQCSAENAAPAPAAPTYSPGGGDAVPFTMVNGGMHVRVNLPGYWADMLVDTGANISAIDAGLADALIAASNATELEPTTVTLAGGRVESRRMINVNSLTISSHTLYNVKMLVHPSGSEQLLSLSVLNAIGKCTIDSVNQQLTFS